MSDPTVAPVALAAPPALAPAPAGATVTLARAQAVAAALARAVQRAAIYPPGHPAVLATAHPVVAAVESALEGHDRLFIGVTSERLYIGPSIEAPPACDSPWLSARLSARGIAAIRLDRGLEPAQAERLIAWLARSTDDPPEAWPALTGIEVVPVDFAAARFREGPASDPSASPSSVAWAAIVRTLTGVDGRVDDPPSDPEALARYVAGVVEHHEGTGMGAFSERLAAVNAEFEALPDEVRVGVKQRLGQFVTALSPHLRQQLLAVGPGRRRGQLEVLAHLVDQLPVGLLADLVQRIDFSPEHADACIDLTLRLSEQTRRDASLAEAFAARCAREGLPPNLAQLDTPEARALLEALVKRRARTGAAGAAAGDAASAAQVHHDSPGRWRIDLSQLTDPASADAMNRQHRELASWLLLLPGGTPAERLACIAIVRENLPARLASGDVRQLAQAAQGFESVVADCPGTDAAATATDALAFFTQPAAVGFVLKALETPEFPVSADLVTLAQVGGVAVAEALLAAVARQTDARARQRLLDALGALDPETVRLAVAALQRGSPSASRSLLNTLAALPNRATVVEATHLLLGDADPQVRRDACRLLFGGPLSAARADALLRRALEDEDGRVVACGLEHVPAHLPGAVRWLLALLDRDPAAGLFPLQRRAAALLAAHATPDLCGPLAEWLAGRGSRLDRPSRVLSRLVADTIEAVGGADGTLAARRWRRSPAGWLGRLLGDHRRLTS